MIENFVYIKSDIKVIKYILIILINIYYLKLLFIIIILFLFTLIFIISAYYNKGYQTLPKYQRDNHEGFRSNLQSEMKHFGTTLKPQA